MPDSCVGSRRVLQIETPQRFQLSQLVQVPFGKMRVGKTKSFDVAQRGKSFEIRSVEMQIIGQSHFDDWDGSCRQIAWPVDRVSPGIVTDRGSIFPRRGDDGYRPPLLQDPPGSEALGIVLGLSSFLRRVG